MTNLTIRVLVLLATLCLLGASSGWAQPAPAPVVGTDITKVVPDVLTLIGPAAPAAALGVKPGDKIAFMGDSITAQAGYVRLTQYVLNTDYPDLKPVIINVGIGGQKAEDMAPRFAHDMRLAEKPAWCFISVGINDVWHRVGAPEDPAVLEAYKANVIKMVDLAQAAGAQVVLLAPTVITEDPNNLGNQRLVAFVAAEKQIAADKQCGFVDLHAMFLTALAAKPAGMRLTADGVHMNPYGDAIMALGVLRALGVPDATVAATDVVPAFRVNALGMTLAQAAAVLEVPVTRFFKPELVRFVGF
ncbi:MAG TPA: SGNH/GDSL hydrolase family protein [Armatimonadota bacterium]|jgi:lysophospholipase L1-like esterase